MPFGRWQEQISSFTVYKGPGGPWKEVHAQRRMKRKSERGMARAEFDHIEVIWSIGSQEEPGRFTLVRQISEPWAARCSP